MRQVGAEVLQKWRELVSEQTRSGQSAAKFCRERGISVWQFYGWKKRLVELETANFVSVELKPGPGMRFYRQEIVRLRYV
jgi:hypothetical protein